jgi:MraZ protein
MSESSAREPIYSSVYNHGVDEKRRVQIPSKWRVSGQDQEFIMVVTPNGFTKDACLTVYSPKLVQQMIAKMAERPFNDPEANAMRRFMGERTDSATVDRAGRICLPESMAEAIGLEKEAVLVGMMDRFQIWSPKGYQESKAGIETMAAHAWPKF